MENIRELKITDLDECVDLFISVFNSEPWNDGWTVEKANKRLQNIFQNSGFYGGYWKYDILIGFACGNKEQWTDLEHFNLIECCVDNEKQNMGIGTKVISKLEQELLGQNCSRIYLLTMRSSLAETFYKKNGYYVNERMIMMGKKLSR